jgi:hypothetical protein
MADNYLTLLDLAQQRGNDQTIGTLESALEDFPEIANVYGRSIGGTSYKIGSRTSRPTAAFRNINEGVDYSKSTFSQQEVNCYTWMVRVAADVQAAKAHPYGAAEYMADEAVAETKAIFELIAKQFFYGQHGASDKGFDGLMTQVEEGMALLAGGTNAAVDGDSDSFRTSAFLVRESIDGAHLVFGLGDQGVQGMADDWRVEGIRDNNGREYDAYKNAMNGWIGLQAVNKSVGVIHNITHEAGSVFDDKTISKALLKFKRSQKPNKIYMTEEAAHKLRESRSSTTNRMGARDKQSKQASGIWADAPTESNNIPIVITDAIALNEAHATA